MDNQTLKQDLYQAIDEFLQLTLTADNETIATRYTTIKVFVDELPVYPNPQTQAQVEAYNLAHGQSEADLLYFSPAAADNQALIDGRASALERLQARAREVEEILRADSEVV